MAMEALLAVTPAKPRDPADFDVFRPPEADLWGGQDEGEVGFRIKGGWGVGLGVDTVGMNEVGVENHTRRSYTRFASNRVDLMNAPSEPGTIVFQMACTFFPRRILSHCIAIPF